MHNWDPEYKKDLTIKVVTFVLSPVLGMLYSLYRLNTKSSFIVLFLCFTTFGLSLIVPETETENYNFDSVRYREWFENSTDKTVNEFKEDCVDYLNFSGKHDFYSTALFFFVSRFTDNYQIMFMFAAIIMAAFMLKTLKFLTSEENYQFSISCLCILFLFMMAQIEKIVVFRFYTAYWMAMYAIFQIFINKSKKHLLLLFVTPFFHGSFFIIYPLYIAYFFLQKSYKMAIGLWIFSFFLSTISLSFFTQLIAILPESLSLHYDAYIDLDYVNRINNGGSGFIWIMRLFEFVLLIAVNILIFVFARKYKENIHKTKCEGMYKFLLVLITFVNFTIMIPSVGSRFVMLTFPLIAYILLVCFYYQQYRNLIYAFAGLFIFFFLCLPWNIYQIPCLSFYNDLWGISLIYSSPIYLFFKYMIL